jgi:hypothetical protein
MSSDQRTPCPYCAELVRIGAIVCPFCIREFSGANQGEVRVADPSARRGIAVLMFIQLVFVVVLLLSALG